MCFLKMFYQIIKFKNNRKKKKIKPIFNQFENDFFTDVFIIDKYSINIEIPCSCTNINKNIIFIENYF